MLACGNVTGLTTHKILLPCPAGLGARSGSPKTTAKNCPLSPNTYLTGCVGWLNPSRAHGGKVAGVNWAAQVAVGVGLLGVVEAAPTFDDAHAPTVAVIARMAA